MRKSTLLSAALILGPAAALAAGMNLVTAIDVAEAGGASEVTIRGSKPPSFTTFSLVDPPRFVVDLAEAAFDGAKRKVPGSGLVKEVNAISFGEGTHATARITVTFVGDVEPPDVVVAGNQLVLRVRAPGGVMVAAAPAPAPAAVAAPVAAPRRHPRLKLWRRQLRRRRRPRTLGLQPRPELPPTRRRQRKQRRPRK